MLRLHRFSDEQLAAQFKMALLKESTYWTPARPTVPTTNGADLGAGVDQKQMMTALVTAAERDEMVAYLQEVCERDDMSLGASTFALAVTLLDRFIATIKVKSKYLECLAVACLYVACKVREEDECVSVTSEFLEDCEAKCSVAELLRMEQMILTKFEWCVDDANIADFVYLYHAMLVNRWNTCHLEIIKPTPSHKRKWKAIDSDISPSKTNSNNFTPLSNEVARINAPAELDVLIELEHQFKQTLCVAELTGLYKPHLLAYALCALQMDRIDPDDEKGMQTLLRYIRFRVKESDELINECKEAVYIHLSQMEATNSLLDRFLGEHLQFHRGTGRRPSMITFHRGLSSIQEEDEESETEHCAETPHKYAKLTKQTGNSNNTTYADALLAHQAAQERTKLGQHREVEREV